MATKNRNEEDRRDFRYQQRKGKKYTDDISIMDPPFIPPPLGFVFALPKDYRKELWLEEHSKEHRIFIAKLSSALDEELRDTEAKYNDLMIQNPKNAEKLGNMMLTEQRKTYNKAGSQIQPKLKKYDEEQHKFEEWMGGRFPDIKLNNVSNEDNLATILQSEISGTGNEREIATVAWVVLNRVRRNKILLIEDLFEGKKIPFNRSQDATKKSKDWVWREFSSGMTPDLTEGATHYYSPNKMFKKGDEPDTKFKNGNWTDEQKKEYRRKFKNQDTGGGLTETPGIEGEHYCPSWAINKSFSELQIEGVRPPVLRVFRKKGNGPVA